MFSQHIMGKKACVSLRAFATTVSGIENCGKTTTLTHILSNAVQTKDEMNITPLLQLDEHRECLSCYKLIILGQYPFKNLTWLISPTETESAVMCLLSYFASLCKNRNNGPGNYIDLLEFVPVPATSEGIIVSDPEVNQQVKLLHTKLKEKWDILKQNKSMQKVMPTGVCLINLFDFGPSKAARDFSPFLNKYCKQSLNITCFNRERDAEALKKELTSETVHDYYQSLTHQLIKPLTGCVCKEQIVALAAISTDPSIQCTNEESRQMIDGWKEEIQKRVGIEKLQLLLVSKETIGEVKSQLEKEVFKVSSSNEILLKFILLLQQMKHKCKSFWMTRSEIESLSRPYEFQNGDLERFLRFFSSFGSIFYTHDIPSLREYVIVDIVKFVKRIHILYNTNDEAARYGLFRYRQEEDWRVLFDFLTTLKIAVEVKSSQILTNPTAPTLSLGTATTYYYIPSARRASGSTPDSASSTAVPSKASSPIELVNQDEYTMENLQVLLCRHLLQSTSCLLIPTETTNTTLIRFCEASWEELEMEFVDIKLIDVGNKITMSTNTKEENVEKICKRIVSTCPFLSRQISGHSQTNKRRLSFPTQKLSGFLENKEQELKDIPLQKMIAIAKELDKHAEGKLSRLASKFELSQSWLEHQDSTMSGWEVVLCMMDQYKKRVSRTEFRRTLKELNIVIS